MQTSFIFSPHACQRIKSCKFVFVKDLHKLYTCDRKTLFRKKIEWNLSFNTNMPSMFLFFFLLRWKKFRRQRKNFESDERNCGFWPFQRSYCNLNACCIQMLRNASDFNKERCQNFDCLIGFYSHWFDWSSHRLCCIQIFFVIMR